MTGPATASGTYGRAAVTAYLGLDGRSKLLLGIVCLPSVLVELDATRAKNLTQKLGKR